MKWKVKDVSFDNMEMLCSRYGLDRVSARILAAGNRTSAEDIKFFLEKDVSYLHNPFLFEDMELFCDRILEAAENKEKVRIFGDRDVDGITSTALMVLELKAMGLENVSWKVPTGDEPYGVTFENIDEAVKEGVTLAVTVDCGISSVQEIDYARTKGLDFLVTDHHIAPDILPAATAVINPKVQGCGYPFSGLAGVGVAAKCIWALRLARTPLYRTPVILLHAMPGNSTVIIEACRTENLLVTDRISEEFVPGTLAQQNSRLLKFLDCGLPILVLDEQVERIQLKKAFPSVDIGLTDIREKLDKYLPKTRGKSLFQLASTSRYAFYSQTKSELDALTGLFFALSRAMYPQLHKDYIGLTDLVAIGTVSDLMPMADENLIFVKNGLVQLEKADRSSLSPFLIRQKLYGKTLTSADIGWQIAPVLNASGRMGEPDTAVRMLLSTTEAEASELAQRLAQLNQMRQKESEDSWNRVLKKAQDTFEKLDSKLVLVDDSSIPRGIAGILATRLQKFFKAPALVITKSADRCIGSMRSPRSFNCHDFLEQFSDLFMDFGGHAFAGGFSIDPLKKDELCLRISEAVEHLEFESEDEDLLEIDAVLTPQEMTLSLPETIRKFEPFGEQNSAPLFLAENARLENVVVMNNQQDAQNAHVRFVLSYGAYKWPCVFWSAGRRAGTEFDSGSIADVVFKIGFNNFRGQENVQLTVMDLRVRK